MSEDATNRWFASQDVDEERLTQIARLAELGLSLAATAHDLRQPLSALKMTLQILRDKAASSPEIREDLREALLQLGRVEALVERTRSLFSPSRGLHRVDVAALAKRIAAEAGWRPERAGGARLETAIDDGVPNIVGDAALLEQLVGNLLNNARDAIAHGGGERVLLAVRSGADRRCVEVVVADDGPGIPPEIAGKVFEPFFTTKGPGGGTGLGLYIVRRVVEDHGAAIALMSAGELRALDRGPLSTGFRIAFPSDGRTDAEAEEQARRSSTPPRPCTRRALVVEDEPTVRRLLSRVLEREGFECAQCGTGEEALEALGERRFDLVVADKNLPGVSGMEVVERARRQRPSIRAVIATGYPSEGSAAEAMALGADDYLLKPLDVDALRSRVRELFDGAGASPPDAPGDAGLRGPAAAPGRRVFVADADMGARRAIESALRELGCDVETHAGGDGLDRALGRSGCSVLVARPEVLRGQRGWLSAGGGCGARSALAIMGREGVEEAIEAIRCGARGIFAPPFSPGAVSETFARLLGHLEDEARWRP